MSGRAGALAGAATLALMLTGCTDVLAGTPVSVFDDPFQVAGMPATDGPSGLRSDAPSQTRTVQGTDGGGADELAAMAVSDIEEFWASAYGHPLRGVFTPVNALISWDSGGLNAKFCDDDTFGVVNAAFCPVDNTIGWDRGGLLPQLRSRFGDMAVAMVLAHEYGHSIQHQSKLTNTSTPTLVSEQQADCFAGVYLRWVAEGDSKRFTLNTGDGLNNLLAAMISFRDPSPTEDDPRMDVKEHGWAFERISAFQFGFTAGVPACAGIDEKDVERRRGELPPALQQARTGERSVSQESVRAVVEALGALFSPANPPRLEFDRPSCARPSDPVSYCPATNAISVDLAQLQMLGTPTYAENSTGLAIGANTAFSALTSRYMLAIERQKGGVSLDNAAAGLRTACLTGVATTKMAHPVTLSDGSRIALTAGDLDQAVSGILTNGLAAADVDGASVPSGFSRIDAFRTGVLGDEDRCFKRYR